MSTILLDICHDIQLLCYWAIHLFMYLFIYFLHYILDTGLVNILILDI